MQDVDLFTAATARCRRRSRRTAVRDARRRSGSVRPAWGSAEMFERGALANENPPKLRRLRRQGPRLDMVEFHPAYHPFMAESVARRPACLDLGRDGDARGRARREVARAARFYMAAQIENGHMCPITMTHAAVAALAASRAGSHTGCRRSRRAQYDPRFRPWCEKTGVTLGMGMTEKQGGTDVRANTTPRRTRSGGGLRASPATNGSCRRRCAMRSWCWRRRRAGSPAF